ncbi:MAG: hypothetical protein IJD28_04535 [Deferribacterales bacterium]|nr:hypothetical protein [Deferribacterales bacterium]
MQKYKVFTKVPWDKSSAIYYILLLFTSCLYSVCFDSARIQMASDVSSPDITLTIVSISSCLVIFFLLMLSRYVFIITCPILFYLGAVGSLYSSELFLDTTEKTAPLFISNDTVSFFISSPENALYIGGMFVLGIVLGIIRFYAQDSSVIRRGQVFAVIVFIAAGSARFMYDSEKSFTPMPAVYFSSIRTYFGEGLSYKLFNSEKAPLKAESTVEDTTVLFITVDKISDKIFKDSISAPLSRKINMEFFTDIEPCAQDYSLSLFCSLTKASKDDFSPINDTKTAVSAFNSAGFKTWWITVKSSLMENSLLAESAAKEAQSYEITETALSPNPFAAMDRLSELSKSTENNFITIHIEGTLPQTEKRYTSVFNKGRDNTYNNYADFIDAFIFETAKLFENKRAIIFFAGLTGEDIEKHPPTVGGNTLFGIWISPVLNAEKDLREKITLNGTSGVSQKSIFHSLTDCSGLISEATDKNMSLCR